MVPTRPFHIDRPSVSRRQLLLSTGTFVAGGGIVAAVGSQPAKGAITTHSLNIPAAEYSGTDGTVADLPIEVFGNYEYATESADELVLALDVAPDNGGDMAGADFQTIDEVIESVSTDSGAGQYTLSGSLLDHPGMSAADFNAEPEETIVREIPVRVVMDVRLDGESVVAALAETQAQITVTNESIEASAAVVGEGEVAIEV